MQAVLSVLTDHRDINLDGKKKVFGSVAICTNAWTIYCFVVCNFSKSGNMLIYMYGIYENKQLLVGNYKTPSFLTGGSVFVMRVCIMTTNY